ncbi:hypothetical protein EYC80_008811 [Monilinia laxa]|uniref:Uncharacterized protein n=1 Tax=Monilinia laxa TaxID=61186 RepID=A0A5N6K1J6_MONLA|nr:hypothetical protein EYC80_008811 [Monilinia laxa]
MVYGMGFLVFKEIWEIPSVFLLVVESSKVIMIKHTRLLFYEKSNERRKGFHGDGFGLVVAKEGRDLCMYAEEVVNE